MTVLARGVRCAVAGVVASVALPLAAAAQVQVPLPIAIPTNTSACVPDVNRVIATRATPASTGALPADVANRLDAAVMAGLRSAATPGAIVGLRSPQGTWIKAYGEADPLTHAPMTVDMHTRVGSVTKTFTGTLLLQLAEQGKLSLDDTIGQYVLGVPNGDVVTLRELANMTSGVASYTRNAAFVDALATNPHQVFTPDQLLAYGLSQSPIFAPGAQFDYSNTNTILLGMVIEKVSGRPIADVLQQQILNPLHLNNTLWPGTSPEMPAPYPQGFTLQSLDATPDHPGNATDWNPSWAWTAGALIMTMPDLLTYGRALGTGQGLLGPAAQAERLAFPDGPGYGLAMGCIDGWVGHTGELPGYNTTLFYDTTRDTVVAVQTNSDIASGDCPESPTLTDDPRETPCLSPAVAIFVPVSEALGHPFTPLPQQ